MFFLWLQGDGYEEIECLGTVDVLRRAGFDLTTVAVASGLSVTGKSKVIVQCDRKLSDVKDQKFDVLVVPGGPGAEKLGSNDEVTAMLAEHVKSGAYVTGICAAPAFVLAKHMAGHKGVCYSSTEKAMGEAFDASYKGATMVDGKFITSRGPATFFDFALTIVKVVISKEKASEVAEALLYKDFA